MNRSINHMVLIKAILEATLKNPEVFNWSLQGFGMFRLYLTDEVRIHLWDSHYRVKDPSDVHTHPWNFDSEIIVGVVKNTRYSERPAEYGAPGPDEALNWVEYSKMLIKAGEGAYVKDTVNSVYLLVHEPEKYVYGECYTQHAEEIHKSEPEPGTVTLVNRTMRTDLCRDEALVFCKPEIGFVTAAPRKATYEEITGAIRRSLQKYSEDWK